MSKQPFPKTFQFKIVKSPDYKVAVVNGVMGGMTTRGQLNMNFFVEVPELPKTTKHMVSVTGKLGAEISAPPNPEPGAVREIIFGVNIDIITAKGLMDWIKKNIENFEALQAEQPGVIISTKTDELGSEALKSS